jgi:serine/threonine protein phosphatase PrpC
VLVASDGISAGPDRREVRRLATSSQPVEDVVAELVDYLAATSSDNWTVALLDPWADPDGLSGTHDG